MEKKTNGGYKEIGKVIYDRRLQQLNSAVDT